MQTTKSNEPTEAIVKQILEVTCYKPELGAEVENGQATQDKAKITFEGFPTPGSDSTLKYAKIYFVEGALMPPRYEKEKGTIHIYKAKSSLADVLVMLHGAGKIHCQYAEYPISVYADVHGEFPVGTGTQG
jgi:hypothetical protein